MRSLRLLLAVPAMLLLTACAHTQIAAPNPPTTTPSTLPTTAPVVNRWQAEINAYLDADRFAPPPQNAIVFVGSSSIRGWRTLQKDFAGLDVIGRGFGGSHTIDVIRYTDVLVLKHRPATIVFYCGENDLASRAATPGDVARQFETFVDMVHRELPRTKIVFISIKPSPSRIDIIDRYREANALIKAYIATDSRLSYVDVFHPMLDEQGQPRLELFGKDRLHMTPAGYAIWTKLVRPCLE